VNSLYAATKTKQFDYTFDDIGNRKTTTRDTRSPAPAAQPRVLRRSADDRK
jgi:hypothetical protein